MSPVAEAVATLARSVRLPLHDEKACQAAFARVLEGAGFAFDREVRLAAGDIVDFMVEGVAVEMKLKGQRMAIYRQLERYAQHDGVSEIVLLTSRSMGLPAEINGKPAGVVSLSMGYL